jgi:cyanophycinase
MAKRTTERNGRTATGRGRSKGNARGGTTGGTNGRGRHPTIGAAPSPTRVPGPSEQRRAVAGQLVIIGGREDRSGEGLILKRVVDCAEGGRIVVCTVASDVPEEVWEDYRKVFHAMGCHDVVHLHIQDRTEILQDPPLDVLDGATVVFFTGGGQLKITTRFSGTRLCAAVEELYRRGATIAGTSAGASVMADTMMVAGPGRETHKIGESLQMAPGLGYIRDVIIDQHFAERGRIGRLLGAVAQNPRLLGIGLDEDTAIVVDHEERFEVIGSGAVYVADAQNITYTNVADEERERSLSIFDVRLHLLSQGDRFDLRTRRPSHDFAAVVEEKLNGSDGRR